MVYFSCKNLSPANGQKLPNISSQLLFIPAGAKSTDYDLRRLELVLGVRGKRLLEVGENLLDRAKEETAAMQLLAAVDAAELFALRQATFLQAHVIELHSSVVLTRTNYLLHLYLTIYNLQV